MAESIPTLKSPRVNYIFISDNFFIKRKGYLSKNAFRLFLWSGLWKLKRIDSFPIIVNSEHTSYIFYSESVTF